MIIKIRLRGSFNGLYARHKMKKVITIPKFKTDEKKGYLVNKQTTNDTKYILDTSKTMKYRYILELSLYLPYKNRFRSKN